MRGVSFLKKKKKKKSRKKKEVKTKSSLDRHHIFYVRNEWNKGELEKLRMHPYCIIPMDRDGIHRYIHTHLAYIPVPKEFNVESVIFQLKCLEKHEVINQEDPIERRLAILIALFECIEQPTADALKEQLRLVHEFKKAPL